MAFIWLEKQIVKEFSPDPLHLILDLRGLCTDEGVIQLFLPTHTGWLTGGSDLVQWEPLTPMSPRQLYDQFCSPEEELLPYTCLKYTHSSQNTDPMTCPLPLEAQKYFPSSWNHLFPDRSTQQKILTFHCRPKVRGPVRLLKSSVGTKPKRKYR